MTTLLWRRARRRGHGKDYRWGTRRACRPQRTLQRLGPLLAAAGITRLADVTGLDCVGLPVFQAVRPNSRNLSVSQGKGLTRDQARVSALMEALEGFHAEQLPGESIRERVGVMRRRLDYDPYRLAVVRRPDAEVYRDPDYDPYAPPIGRPCLLSDESVVDWVEATCLATGRPSRVPRQLCELDFCMQPRLCIPYFRATSNGLASGNSTPEALVHGLCEVVERDSSFRNAGAHHEPDRWIDPSTVDSRLAAGLLVRFLRAGLDTRIVDVTGPTGLPSFDVVLSQPGSADRHLGAGCHPQRTTALLRALTEAAQSRLAHISGSRDDFFRRGYRGVRGSAATAVSPAPRADFRRVPTLPASRWVQTWREIASRIERLTGMAPLAVDLRRAPFRLPVVFVVAPGLNIIPPRRR